MKRQFIILTCTAILLIMGWTAVEYMLQSQIQYQLNQLSTYPVMIYTWDADLMTQIKASLSQYDFIKNTEYKDSETASSELIKKYGLQGAEEILEQKSLPNVLIIYLKGDMKSRANKLILKDLLENGSFKNQIMTEMQNDVWTKTWQRIDQFQQIRWIFLSFIALVIFLVFFFKRLHYEHRLARIMQLTHLNAVDEIRSHDRFWMNSLLLVPLPVLIGFFAYQILYYIDWLLFSIPWYFFLIQLAIVALATLAAYPFVIKYRHEEPIQRPHES
jgi:hypothetical protein